MAMFDKLKNKQQNTIIKDKDGYTTCYFDGCEISESDYGSEKLTFTVVCKSTNKEGVKKSLVTGTSINSDTIDGELNHFTNLVCKLGIIKLSDIIEALNNEDEDAYQEFITKTFDDLEKFISDGKKFKVKINTTRDKKEGYLSSRFDINSIAVIK